MKISLINVNISYKRVTSTLFSELFQCLLFLKNNQPEIFLMPKRYILRWYMLLLFRTIAFLRPEGARRGEQFLELQEGSSERASTDRNCTLGRETQLQPT